MCGVSLFSFSGPFTTATVVFFPNLGVAFIPLDLPLDEVILAWSCLTSVPPVVSQWRGTSFHLKIIKVFFVKFPNLAHTYFCCAPTVMIFVLYQLLVLDIKSG